MERLDCECPPFWIYAYARKYRRGPWIGVDELCKLSGIPRRSVIRLGSKISWKGVKAEVIAAFLKGCGLRMSGGNIFSLQKVRKFIHYQHQHAHRPYAHLNAQQWAQFNRLCKKWAELHK